MCKLIFCGWSVEMQNWFCYTIYVDMFQEIYSYIFMFDIPSTSYHIQVFKDGVAKGTEFL